MPSSQSTGLGLSRPLEESVTSPRSGRINGTVIDLAKQNAGRQASKESDGLCVSGGVVLVDIAVEEDLDADGVDQQGGDKIVAWQLH